MSGLSYVAYEEFEELEAYLKQQLGLLQQEDTRLYNLISALATRVENLEKSQPSFELDGSTLNIT